MKKRRATREYYRNGPNYFRARLVKSRGRVKVWWLYPGGEVAASKDYPASLLEKSKKLAGRPSRKTLIRANAVHFLEHGPT